MCILTDYSLNDKIDMLYNDAEQSHSILKSKDEEIDRLQSYAMNLTNEFEVAKQNLAKSSKFYKLISRCGY